MKQILPNASVYSMFCVPPVFILCGLAHNFSSSSLHFPPRYFRHCIIRCAKVLVFAESFLSPVNFCWGIFEPESNFDFCHLFDVLRHHRCDANNWGEIDEATRRIGIEYDFIQFRYEKYSRVVSSGLELDKTMFHTNLLCPNFSKMYGIWSSC